MTAAVVGALSMTAPLDAQRGQRVGGESDASMNIGQATITTPDGRRI
jgi:hypothetical protein